MSSTYTPSLTLTKIGNGEQSGTWGTTTNTNWQLIEDAVAGVATITLSGTSSHTLTVANGATDESRKAVIIAVGATSGTCAVIAPLEPKVYIISNQTTGGNDITIGATTGTVITVPSGLTTLVYCDGTNFYAGITGFTGGNLSITGTITATGTVTAPTFSGNLGGGAANKIVYQTGANVTNFIDSPANDTTRFLSYVPGTGFLWQTSSTTASNINGGAANQVVYQSGSGTTTFTNSPTSGTPQVLTWNGTQILWASGGSVNSFSGGTTGLTPSSPASGAIVLGGVLNVANGGTQLSSSGASGNLLVSNGSAWTSSSPASAGLATTSALSAYAPLGGATFTGTVSAPFLLNSSGASGILADGSIRIGNSSTTMFYLSNQVQLAINGNFNFYFDQSGAAYKPGGGSWAATSDERLKDNVTPLAGALAKITALNPVNYSWKYDTNEPTVGFIAQEVQQVIPTAVSETNPTKAQENIVHSGKVLAVGFQNDMYAYLVGAIKELNAKVDAQAAEIAALKAK